MLVIIARRLLLFLATAGVLPLEVSCQYWDVEELGLPRQIFCILPDDKKFQSVTHTKEKRSSIIYTSMVSGSSTSVVSGRKSARTAPRKLSRDRMMNGRHWEW